MADPGKEQVSEEEAAPEAKPDQDKDEKGKKILAWVVGVLAVIAIAAGVYWMLSDKEGALYRTLGGSGGETGSEAEGQESSGEAGGEGEDVQDEDSGDDDADAQANEDDAEDGTDDPNDPYQGWATYVNPSTEPGCAVVVRHPTDWTASAAAEYVEITKDNYVWRFDYDPIVTGGGHGYMMGEPVPPSTETQSAVTPDTYNATMLTKYITKQDIIDSGAEGVDEAFGFTGEVWEGTVLFSDVNSMTLGFGPGALNNSTDCDYYGISYTYDSQTSDFSDLPAKGDATLNQMLTIMDQITNSVDI